MSQEVDDFLAHYGVKGMKWGVRRRRTTSDGSPMPTRRELRGMDRAARARQKSAAQEESRKKDESILEARANRGAARQAIREARRQYKNDRRMVGKVTAREIMNANSEKSYETLDLAAQQTEREIARAMLIDFGLRSAAAIVRAAS